MKKRIEIIRKLVGTSMKEEILLFIVLITAIFCGEGNILGIINIFDLGSNIGSLLFVIYIVFAFLFTIPAKYILYIGTFALYLMIIFRLLGYSLVAETLAIFSISMLSLNGVILLYSLRSRSVAI